MKNIIEDSKAIIRRRKSIKARQYKGQTIQWPKEQTRTKKQTMIYKILKIEQTTSTEIRDERKDKQFLY
jgi:hypothetical protein